MRIAFFSPLPPARSGIADYAQTLLEHLSLLANVETFPDGARPFDPAAFDVALYHIGNNPHHAFAYQAALRHPGIVVLHESNLHHLIAHLTINRGDWDAYLRECEFDAGPDALAYARRVRALEVGPDYEGVPMTRRILQSARGVIVHSRYMLDRIRAAGYTGPVAQIPHGAWIPHADRLSYRYRLGLDEITPLAGIFGFLKPYKRIAESLRAFRRVVRLQPEAKMILVGEPHPDLQLPPLLRALDLSAPVRSLGFVPPQDFTGYMAACDIVLNLRYPTVGETSGSLLRALGLGKAVLVSDVGSFRELPDDICLKVPVDAPEEDVIFEYLNLLLSRPDLARQLGARARAWVEQKCTWEIVARRYLEFLAAPDSPPAATPSASLPPSPSPPPPDPAYLAGWAPPGEARDYVETHRSRLVRTLEITPPGASADRILEMGAYLQLTPALRTHLGYGYVRGCYYGPAGTVKHRSIQSETGESFCCDIDLFDAERDPFPYADDFFSTVLCGELIEHLCTDPMHLMCEVNRITRTGGHLVLTTPNIASLRAIAATLQGYHPGFFHAYIKPAESGDVEARHNREYTPREIHLLLENAGFRVTLLDTGPFREQPHPEYGWVMHLLERYGLSADLRGDGIYAVGEKIGPVRERYPSWLYA